MRTPTLALLLAAAVLGGCATHHTLREPRSVLEARLVTDPKEVSRLEKALTDKDLAALLDADIRAKLPTKLAVACVSDPWWGCWRRGGPAWPQGAEELVAWESVIQGVPALVGVQPVSPVLQGDGRAGLHDLRSAAARLGCELLLVCLVSHSAVDNYNDAAALYWTFVGLWLVPGNVYEHRTLMQAILVDTRTGAVLGTAGGDAHRRAACAAAYGDIQRTKLAEEAGRKAADSFRQACRNMLRDVVAAAQRRPA